MKKALLIIGGIIVLLVIGVLIFLRLFTHNPLTDYNQNIVLNNLEAEVQVFRDENGIPHIIAENENDLYRAAGYVTAEDRLWQMDLLRRATQGTLSEIFGEDFIKTDLLLRALQISQKSEMVYKKLSKVEKDALDAYADGVNQFIQENIDKLPIEFKILGYKPAAWTPQNSLNAVGYMAWDLVTAWSNEITLYQIQQKVDSALFAQFIPNFEGDSTIYHLATNIPNQIESPLNTLGSTIENLGIIPFMASNNWVVDGEKSANGTPILCNDMHLGYGTPGIWYQMHLIVKDKMNVTGVNIPGTPGIVAGHNEHIAWGMTNVML
ncbi:MAG: penicillin acylase family protein, partial [Bacteroidota bacterium]|nr:penicillin acylase family protein [Bacteroidota bacterium]